MAPWNRQGNKRKPVNISGVINILQTYAQTPEDVELFLSDSSVPLSYLNYSEVLAAFPSGDIPQHPFDCKFLQWQIQSSTRPGSRRSVHLAVLLPSSSNSTPDHRLPASNTDTASNAGLFGLQDSKASGTTPNRNHSAVHLKQRPRIMASSPADKEQLCNDDECSAFEDEYALQQYNADMNGSPGSFSNGRGDSPHPNANGCGRSTTTPFSNGSGPQHYQQQQQHHNQQQQQQQHLNGIELERRKFMRNLLSANNKKESLERYKAIMSLIEACKRRLAAQLPAGASSVSDVPWGSEPAASSLMQAVLDVGEALASFGNCHFPEHSNEARAILAGDYRALLRQYLSHFGFMFAQPTKEQLSHDLQEEVQSVGSLLATRCEAYDLLYDQLVRHVGLEGRGGPSTIVLNHNNAAANPTTSITANPTNTTTASANSKSKAVNKGLGGAAIAAAGLVGLLVMRAMRGGGGGGGHGRGRGRGGGSSSGSSGNGGSSLVQQQRTLRIPKGKGGRELLLVSQLSACGDELRRARHNDELLKDDWRLGRHVRLAWPPGPPEPPGYQALAPDACNVSNLLQEMYG